jgi:hypothetical protein
VYNVSMINVYLVKFKSSGEVWHSAICAKESDVRDVLQGYAITEQVYAASDNSFREFRNPQDVSQSATVSVHVLIDRS